MIAALPPARGRRWCVRPPAVAAQRCSIGSGAVLTGATRARSRRRRGPAATSHGHDGPERGAEPRFTSASVGVQGGVEVDAVAGPGPDLDGAGERVAPEEQPVWRRTARAALTTAPPARRDLRAGGDVEAGLDDAVVAEGDADAGVRPRAGSARRSMICCLPPPDSVPMIEAPPPMSEPSPTTTPAEIRPSTIDVPRVPALKLTKPSCITVVPSARCAPRRTRSASAIRTPAGTT